MICPRKKRPIKDEDFSAIVVPSMKGHGYLDYTIESHPSRAFELMDELRHHGLLCDMVLHVTYKDTVVDFKVHKLVLAACSPYFKAMFTSNFKECLASEITLKDVCPQVVERLVNFAYTSRITVGEKCVLHVLLTAMRYQMEDVAKACCDFLIKNLEPSNVIGISRFAEELGCMELHQRCREYINTHFSEVIKEEEFFSLSHCQLLELISQDSLKVLCETEVYKACIDWVRWDVEGRAQYFHALLNAVHIYALPAKFLKRQLQSCPILSKANSCKDFLSKIFQDMTLRKPLPPAPLRGTQLIYVAGGYNQHSLGSMEAFDPRRKTWLQLADMETPCSGLGACVLFGLFYAVGGRNLSLQSNIDSAALSCYNPMTNQWTQLASLNVPRNRVGIGELDGSIYAVGGSHGSTHHNTVERYDPEANRWTFVMPMSVARLGAGVASCGGALYVIGGFDGENRWKTVERYQPDTNAWQQVAPMNTVRSGLGVVCMDSYLYAVGGYDGQTQLNTMERYNVSRDVWEPMASMGHCRSAHGVTVYQGKLFVFGGFNQGGFLSSVECYCPGSNQWTYVTDMPVGRSGMGMAVTMEPCPGCLQEEEEEVA
ncbi:kelch-like ECH-associated protein 1A [Pygocentrus nattereri]|uniref:BTB domain-containing protein n=1 Tax=Pygocentrus nattereri TaxID=42514 RepID=A0A3B4EJF1_PYGNA|nr:kelch-like ECH-associated protein 1A [Pygocentrus nattereri]XP_017555758.1 kelch-like ECH-associated protein 1A [Pygocentrus nattereri]XP_017555759.1 kelch-like ECH-associated protein 1A [Pygocentrus nattereri]XP_017555760.1 kelch-like ECH-associated protein 1A [Pygocentrus nattereri]